MKISKPFHLQNWISENQELLKPPVGNKNLYKDSGDYIVMVVGGPNQRKDYHYNQTEELFYQLEGNIKVHIQIDGEKQTIALGPGEMFLLPAGIPHSPERSAGSVGLVIERKRAGKGFTDGLLWFCDGCNNKLHEVYFELKDIEKDFLPHFEHFKKTKELQKCSKCGEYLSF